MAKPDQQEPAERPSRDAVSALASNGRATAAYLLRARMHVPGRVSADLITDLLQQPPEVIAFTVAELLDAAVTLARDAAGHLRHGDPVKREERVLTHLWDRLELEALTKYPSGS